MIFTINQGNSIGQMFTVNSDRLEVSTSEARSALSDKGFDVGDDVSDADVRIMSLAHGILTRTVQATAGTCAAQIGATQEQLATIATELINSTNPSINAWIGAKLPEICTWHRDNCTEQENDFLFALSTCPEYDSLTLRQNRELLPIVLGSSSTEMFSIVTEIVGRNLGRRLRSNFPETNDNQQQ